MPLQPEEVLNQLIRARDEARETIRELHEARSAALDVDKKQRERITQLIVTEVERQVGVLAADARAQMQGRMGAVINDIEELWRAALHLPPPPRP
jgi:hypothetical protein